MGQVKHRLHGFLKMPCPDFIQQQSYQHRENQVTHQLHYRDKQGIPDNAPEARQGKEVLVIIQAHPFLPEKPFQRGIVFKGHGDSRKRNVFKNKGNYHCRQQHEVERHFLPEPALSFLYGNSSHIIPSFLYFQYNRG